MSKQMSSGEAIRMLERRIDWLNGKIKERQEENKPVDIFFDELEANTCAIKALTFVRDLNIKTKGKAFQILEDLSIKENITPLQE